MNSVRDRKMQKRRLWIEVLQLINIILITGLYATGWMWYYRTELVIPYYQKGSIVIILLFAILYMVLGRTYSGFKIEILRISEIIYSQVLAECMAGAIMYLVTFLLMKDFPSVLPAFAILVVQAVTSTLWARIVHRFYFKKVKPEKTVVVWDTRESLDGLIRSYGLEKRFQITNIYHIDKFINNFEEKLVDAEVVFLCGIHSHERNQVAKYCVEHGKKMYLIPRIGDVIMGSAESIHLFHLPMMHLERYNPSPFYVFLKRAFDIVSSGIALLVLSPLMIVVAILIKRDGGTAFYKQTRLTKNGKTFEVLKFRSMRMDAEKDGVARLSTGAADDRITPIGKFIRACRIDELPQLINILKGDMSVVGPRPERPEIAKEYQKTMPEFSLRLQVKAGLTGQAQVYGKYNTTPYDKLLMDLQYIASANMIEDLRIILATVKILFLPESTEGVAVGATTAMDYENVADSTENGAKTVAK